MSDILEIPVLGTLDSDHSGSSSFSSSYVSPSQKPTVTPQLRESHGGSHWKSVIEALKKKSRRGFSTIPILSVPTFRAPFDYIHLLDDFDSYPFLLITQNGSTSFQLLGKRNPISDWFKKVEGSSLFLRKKKRVKSSFYT
jgi:hypothetical protein